MKYIKIGSAYQLTENLIVQTSVYGYLIEDGFFTLKLDGILSIKRGYTWDGASGAIDTKSILRASLVHDIFCDLINKGRLPKAIQKLVDRELVKIIEEYWAWIRKNGTRQQKVREYLLRPFIWFRKKYVYRAVRIYQENKKKPFIRKEYETI